MNQLASAILLVVASSGANADDTTKTPPVVSSYAGSKRPPDRAPSLMTRPEIEAYNKGLDRAHPHYITCRREPVLGSLARKLRVCRTNEQWKSFAAQGNDEGRAILDEMSHAPVNNGN